MKESEYLKEGKIPTEWQIWFLVIPIPRVLEARPPDLAHLETNPCR